MEKTVVIACGAGLATSSMVRDKIEEVLSENNIRANIIQTTLNELEGYDDKADIFITTMKINSDYTTPVVHGSALLTGINEETVIEQIVEILK
ncbi:PTS sugar transporter subunit IIB [Enterococcus avium]|jgi:galactitol PTS system EIIB component|uniref:PTS sugar transporter subunit IIB n=1 Tax=Enterococcus avium TaxID=33945 RepID=UPI0010CA2864|nr:PTS sugar transporter subunit IIB [Enterococcus avium]QCQ13869.1 PTS galactitol transporter subunit IIB [Enterococcus avium]